MCQGGSGQISLTTERWETAPFNADKIIEFCVDIEGQNNYEIGQSICPMLFFLFFYFFLSE